MGTGGFSGGQYRSLEQTQVETIHRTALAVLEEVGVTYEEGFERFLPVLEKGGACVDRERARVTFPHAFITEHIARAPHQVFLYSRDGKNDLDLYHDRVYFGTGGAAINVLDLDTGQPRAARLDDLYYLGRLVDRLEHIHFYLRPCIPNDIPTHLLDENIFFTCLKATAKHVMAGVNSIDGLHRVLALAALIAGEMKTFTERPFCSIVTSFAMSPLAFNSQTTAIMLEACKLGIPVALSAAPIAGLTSPMTLAGTLVQLHAEEMAGIALCQLFYPGSPVLYGGVPGVANLRNGSYMGGAVEAAMMNAAVHQLAQYIDIPNYNSSGITDSKLPDIQAGWEKALSTLLVAMGGSNYIHHAAGMLESMLTVAYEQYVLDDEIIGMCSRVLEGIKTGEEYCAFEAIREVGPGGSFMTSRHTLDHMYTEVINALGVSDHSRREDWVQEGGKDARERARELARKHIKENKKVYFGSELEKKLRSRFSLLLKAE
jgi:trimethylamine--corrinoid protein Co-methyltransferase